MTKNVTLVGVALLFLYSVSYATVWYVHPDSTLNSIQAALDGCSTGDTVLVGPGIYYEHLIWPNIEGIDLVSEFGPESTMIHGSYLGRPLDISYVYIDSTTIVDGFKIRRGLATRGSGIRLSSCSPIIRNNIITDNESSGFDWCGAGILCESGANAIIENNEISINKAAGYFGGIGCVNSSPSIVNNHIIGNICDSIGGGIGCLQSSPYIADNTIEYDSARWGGGIGMFFDSNPTIIGNIIRNNYAHTSGGGLYCYQNSAPIITRNTITDNYCLSISGLGGGGIRCSPYANAMIKLNIIADNWSTGITIITSSPTIDSNTIANNSYGIYAADNANPTIYQNNIYGNSTMGVWNFMNQMILADSNWWGDSTGPFHYSLNPGGLGNSVSDSVNFVPWCIDSIPWQLGIEKGEVIKSLACNLKASPNPFRHKVDITFSIGPTLETMGFTIFDAAGRVVRKLKCVTNQQISWDGTDKANRKLPSGVYFLQVEAGDYSATKKVLFIR